MLLFVAEVAGFGVRLLHCCEHGPLDSAEFVGIVCALQCRGLCGNTSQLSEFRAFYVGSHCKQRRAETRSFVCALCVVGSGLPPGLDQLQLLVTF